LNCLKTDWTGDFDVINIEFLKFIKMLVTLFRICGLNFPRCL
jgi:hypothetical protein